MKELLKVFRPRSIRPVTTEVRYREDARGESDPKPPFQVRLDQEQLRKLLEDEFRLKPEQTGQWRVSLFDRPVSINLQLQSQSTAKPEQHGMLVVGQAIGGATQRERAPDGKREIYIELGVPFLQFNARRSGLLGYAELAHKNDRSPEEEARLSRMRKGIETELRSKLLPAYLAKATPERIEQFLNRFLGWEVRREIVTVLIHEITHAKIADEIEQLTKKALTELKLSNRLTDGTIFLSGVIVGGAILGNTNNYSALIIALVSVDGTMLFLTRLLIKDAKEQTAIATQASNLSEQKAVASVTPDRVRKWRKLVSLIEEKSA